MKCSKNFTLAVGDMPCAVFDDIAWDAPSYDDGGGLQSASGTWDGPNFQFVLGAPVTNLNVGASNSGFTLIDSGPIIVMLDVTWVSAPGNGGLAFNIALSTNNYGQFGGVSNGDMAANTTHHFEFALGPTVADTFEIDVQGNIFIGFPATATITGVLSCVSAIGNTVQTAHVPCPGACTGTGGDGNVPANTYYAATLIAANALALAAAQQQAQDNADISCACAPDFSLMQWAVPTLANSSGTAAFLPSGTQAASFAGSATASVVVPAFPPLVDHFGECTTSGQLINATPWTGNCNFHFEFSGTAASPANFTYDVDVLVDGNNVASSSYSGPFNGIFDFPFSVTGATQVDIAIHYRVDAKNVGAPGAANISVSGLFTNV